MVMLSNFSLFVSPFTSPQTETLKDMFADVNFDTLLAAVVTIISLVLSLPYHFSGTIWTQYWLLLGVWIVREYVLPCSRANVRLDFFLGLRTKTLSSFHETRTNKRTKHSFPKFQNKN